MLIEEPQYTISTVARDLELLLNKLHTKVADNLFHEKAQLINYQQHQHTTRLSRKSYMLQAKRSKLVPMGDRAFSVVAPKYWNELPDVIRNIELPLDIFKEKLKTHYFKMAYC